MPLIIPPGFAQVSLEFSALSPLGSKPATTFGVAAAPSAVLNDAIYAWWHEGYRDRQDSNTQLLRIVSRSDVGFYDTAVGESGLGSGGAASPQVSPLIRKITGQAGRSKRGRMYWPHVLGIGNVEENGTLGGTTVGDLQDIADELFTVCSTFGVGMVLLHTASSDPTTVEALQVQAQAATQRRRNRK